MPCPFLHKKEDNNSSQIAFFVGLPTNRSLRHALVKNRVWWWTTKSPTHPTPLWSPLRRTTCRPWQGLRRRGDGVVMCEPEVVHTRDHPAGTEPVQNTHPSLSTLTDIVTWQQRCSDLLSSPKTLPDRALDARIPMERALDFLQLGALEGFRDVDFLQLRGLDFLQLFLPGLPVQELHFLQLFRGHSTHQSSS